MHLQTHMLSELNDIIHIKNLEECHAYWILRCQSKLKGERERNEDGEGYSMKAFRLQENMNLYMLTGEYHCKNSSTEKSSTKQCRCKWGSSSGPGWVWLNAWQNFPSHYIKLTIAMSF